MKSALIAGLALASVSVAALTTPVSAASFQYVSGLVLLDGSTLVSSQSYTVQHPKTGKYEVTFARPFKPYPNCLAVAFATGARLTGLFVYKPKKPVSCTFYFEDIKTSKPEDTYFSFQALPISH